MVCKSFQAIIGAVLLTHRVYTHIHSQLQSASFDFMWFERKISAKNIGWNLVRIVLIRSSGNNTQFYPNQTFSYGLYSV